MSKNTLSTHMPRKLEDILTIMGQQIELARKRRRLSRLQISKAASCSQLTVMRIEQGSPKVSFGAYARVLYAMGLHDDILLLAKDDELGRLLQDRDLLYGKNNVTHGTAEIEFD